MSAETYLNLLEAIQAHIADDAGSDTYAPHWILIAGIADISGTTIEEVLRMYRSPNTSPYVVSGLLEWAGIISHPELDVSE